MKIGSMLGDITLSLFQHPVTEKYPLKKSPAPERLRSQLIWDSGKCTGCGICSMDCTAQAIEMIVIDKKAKRFVMQYHVDRCTFCAQCVHSCMQGCLQMSNNGWELASLDRDRFEIQYGSREDIDEVLARASQSHD